jgi:hypothetical protein
VASILNLNQQAVRNWIDQGMLRRSDFDQLIGELRRRWAA